MKEKLIIQIDRFDNFIDNFNHFIDENGGIIAIAFVSTMTILLLLILK